MKGLMQDWPLTVMSIIDHAKRFHGEREVVTRTVEGPIHRTTYADIHLRARKTAQALTKLGVKQGDMVATMAWNTYRHMEAWYGIMGMGAVCHTLNPRLFAEQLTYIINHAEDKFIIFDTSFVPVIEAGADTIPNVKGFIILTDKAHMPETKLKNVYCFDDLVEAEDGNFDWADVDENDACGLCYTSGTTGNPKGVVYHHRGATLMCYANVLAANMAKHPVYLWTLPMFHCNGCCFPWTLSSVIGTHVCLRWVRADAVYKAIAEHGVTHLCGAPIVMSTLLNAPPEERRELPHLVEFVTAAAPPPESVLAQMADARFNVTHVYGLTETYGPSVVNEWHSNWDDLDAAGRAGKKARQGVQYAALEDLTVMDPETMQPVPRDGETMGEVMFRGNIVMKGYLKNPKATDESFAGGWFHSGDLGVLYPDGYIQLKDRSKDIIISGGENISSIEVEEVLFKHPAIALCGVVAMPNEKWGETPCAFVELKPGKTLTEAEVIAWCQEHLARFKCPRHVVFREIPKTSTGKIQKFRLRDMAREVN